MTDSDPQNKESNEQGRLFCLPVYVSYRSNISHGEAGGFGLPTHEAHPVAPEGSLVCPRAPGQEDTFSQISLSSPAVVAERRQCAQGPTSASSAACSTVVYRCLKQNSKGHVVQTRKPVEHKFSQVKSGSVGPQEVQTTVLGPYCVIHKQKEGVRD